MTLNVLEAVRREAPDAAVLLAGSGEVYGAPEALPVTEDARLRPQNPYAVSKAACDLLGGQYADAHGLRVVRTRSFNSAGPDQSEEYVVGTLTRQVAQAELAGERGVELATGNVDSRRDFTDVRDVARAYRSALALPSGVYNVCSGVSTSVRELIEGLSRLTALELTHVVNSERTRAHDPPEIVGSPRRLQEATGWKPELALEQTLRDALAAWRERLSGEATAR
jgi:GDP-4-dehydro-6-deoxy-D-mannose reductase